MIGFDLVWLFMCKADCLIIKPGSLMQTHYLLTVLLFVFCTSVCFLHCCVKLNVLFYFCEWN